MNIREILDDYKIEYRETGQHKNVRSGWIGLECPFCGNSSGKYHLGINTEGSYSTCWSCGPHSVYEILMELTDESKSKCWSLVKDLPSVSKTVRKAMRRDSRLVMPPGVGGLERAHRAYLKGRNFDVENLVKLWDLRGISVASKLSWRIWIPVFSKGEVVNWTTRCIGNSTGNKYVSAKAGQFSIPLKSLLFGEDYCRHSVIVTEGPFDVFSIGPGAVATFGVNTSEEQIERIAKYPIRVVCFDSDKPARKRAERIASELEMYPGETHLVTLETGKDPGEASREEIEKLREEFLDE